MKKGNTSSLVNALLLVSHVGEVELRFCGYARGACQWRNPEHVREDVDTREHSHPWRWLVRHHLGSLQSGQCAKYDNDQSRYDGIME